MKIKIRHLDRGINRETLNADFMRLQNYRVVDNPKLLPSDKLNMLKRPDHRITGFIWNGTIFDSYSPSYEIKCNGENQSKDTLSDENSHASSILLQQNFLMKKMGEKVSSRIGSGQTRNILLNVSDMIHKKELCTDEFARRLNNSTRLFESLIVIYPQANSAARNMIKSGKAKGWGIYLSCDMEAVYWKKGNTTFLPLPRAEDESSSSSESEKSSADEDDKENKDNDNQGPQERPRPSINPLDKGSEGVCPFLSSLFTSLVGFLGGILMFGFLANLRNKKAQKKYPRRISKHVQMYKRQMRLAIGSNVTDEAFQKMHHDLENIIAVRLIPDSQIRKEFKEVIDDKYNDLSSERWATEVLDTIFDNQFYTALLLFLHLVSRLTSKVISATSKGRISQGSVVAIHISLLLFCFFAEYFLQICFLRFLSGPFRFAASICWISLITWSLHFVLGRFSKVGNCIVNVSDRIWILTEEAAKDPTMNTPKRMAITLFIFGSLRITARFLISLSILGGIFTISAKVFKPIILLVRAFAYLATFAKLINVFSVMLAVFLVAFTVERITKRSELTHWLNTPIVNGKTIAGVCDTAWIKMSSVLGTNQLIAEADTP